MAAFSIRCEPDNTAGKLWIALLNRSCTSQTRKMHLSGESRAILRAILASGALAELANKAPVHRG